MFGFRSLRAGNAVTCRSDVGPVRKSLKIAKMWVYIQTLLPLLTIALTAAICFSMVSIIMGQARPQRR
jgi:hypothetical protein